ncbi:LAMI_0F06502g1_1 [Lachancea mirantina]|uniref:LAMI_0F06502g1_1 n=1 Tax=Lachancea mirantina TaxID=1230905 RepID=A0A1G4JYZ8_9SACH|nr:LAMI_0F06502g1_1 [Lachancea mirantina]
MNVLDNATSQKVRNQEDAKPPRTRMRLSFVCQNCRRRKIKCDKSQPQCGRCAKLHLKCVYDYQDSGVSGSDKSSGTLSTQLSELEIKLRQIKEALQAEQAYDVDERSPSTPDRPIPIRINFYKGLAHAPYDDSFKQDHKPFSDMALIERHARLNPFLKYVTRSFQPMKFAVQKIVHSLGGQMDVGSDDIESMAHILFLTPEIRTKIKHQKMSTKHIPEETSTAIKKCLMDRNAARDARLTYEPMEVDFFFTSYGLEAITESILKNIPKRTQMLKLMEYFKQVVYPIVPYVDCGVLEKTISDAILFAGTGQAVRLNLGSPQNVFHSLGCLAILLVVLRISYTSMMLVEKKFEVEITNDAISVAQRCLAFLVAKCQESNEELLSCLILIRWALVFSPKEGEIVAHSMTDTVLSLVVKHALKIGLYRDCIGVSVDSNLSREARHRLQFRRKLWIGTLVLLRSDFCIRGSFPLLSGDYLHMVAKEDPAECYESEAEARIHKILHLQHDLFLANSRLDVLALSVKEDINLERIYESLAVVDSRLRYHKAQVMAVSPSLKGTFQERVLRSMENALNLKSNLIFKIFGLAVRASIVYDLERQSRDCCGSSDMLVMKYKEAAMDCFETVVDLGEHLRDYMGSSYSEGEMFILEDHRYILNKLVQIGIFRVSYYLLGMMLTFLNVRSLLERGATLSQEKSSAVADMESKIPLLTKIVKSIFAYLQKLIDLGSQKYADRYFTSFKQFLFLDYAMRMMHNELLPHSRSKLDQILYADDIPLAVDYNLSDWTILTNYIDQALDVQVLKDSPPADEQPPSEGVDISAFPAESALLGTPLLFDEENAIQSMLNGDYNWSDYQVT